MYDSLVLTIVLSVITLLFIANISHFITKKTGLPYSIFLVLIGAVLHTFKADFPAFQDTALTPELLFFVFLPPLLFESAFHLNLRKLKKDAFIIITLATAGVVITSFVVAVLVNQWLGIPIWISLLLASVLSSTDPIAVIAIFKELGAPKRLLHLVEAESMLNDGTSIIFSKIILSILSVGFVGEDLVWNGANFIFVVFGAVVFGVIVAFVSSWVIYNLKNEMLMEVTVTLLAAFGSFLIAEEFLRVSGVIATVTTGVFLGNFGREKFSIQIKSFVKEIWEYLAFLANSLVFLLVGITFGFELLFANPLRIIVVFLAVLIGRSAGVYILSFIHNQFFVDNQIPVSWMHVLNWGGLRGSLPLAIVLSLPEDLAYRAELLNLTVGVVLMYLLVNGLTIKPLIHWLKIDQLSSLEKAKAEISKTLLLIQSKIHIDELKALGEIPDALDTKVYKAYQDKLESSYHDLESLGKFQRECLKKALYQMAFQTERDVFTNLYEKRVISEKILRKLQEKLDEGLDLIESGIYPEEFQKSKIMKYISSKSKKDFRLRDLFLYRKAREVANLKVLQKFGVLSEVKVLGNVYSEFRATYQKLLDKNQLVCRRLIKNYPDEIKKYEWDICNREVLAMEEDILHDLHNQGVVNTNSINILDSFA